MDVEDPLIEFKNQRQPRRKVTQTYGKKNAGSSHGRQAEAIFGHDQSDITDQLANLNLNLTAEENAKSDIGNISAKSVHARHTPVKSEDSSSSKQEIQSFQDDEGIDHEHTKSNNIELLLDLAGSLEVENFSSFGNKLSKLFEVTKIGEGSFAEVFKITTRPDSSTSSNSLSRYDRHGKISQSQSLSPSYTSIIKVIPLDYKVDHLEARERCSTIQSVAHEVNILKHLDPVHGFTRFRGLRLVTGSWPSSFLSAFNDFRKRHRKRAINAPPDQDFGSEQTYALVEMDDAGAEISLIKRPSVFQVWDIFWISVILLANAEESIEFEHRDLHMSNVCVKKVWGHQEGTQNSSQPTRMENATRTAASTIPDIAASLLMKLNETPTSRIGLSDLRVTIIDYTVARAKLSPANPGNSPSHTKKLDFKAKSRSVGHDDTVVEDAAEDHHDTIMFDPLSFTSDPLASDPNDIESYLQNRTYKKTRAIAVYNAKLTNHAIQPSPSKSRGNPAAERPQFSHEDKWRAFVPRTNTVWLGYLLRILIHRSRSKVGRLNILKGKPGKTGNNVFVKDLQDRMWDILIDVSKVLNGSDYKETESFQNGGGKEDADGPDEKEEVVDEPTWTEDQLEDLPLSALEILEIAVGSGWLDLEEIQDFRKVLEDENS